MNIPNPFCFTREQLEPFLESLRQQTTDPHLSKLPSGTTDLLMVHAGIFLNMELAQWVYDHESPKVLWKVGAEELHSEELIQSFKILKLGSSLEIPMGPIENWPLKRILGPYTEGAVMTYSDASQAGVSTLDPETGHLKFQAIGGWNVFHWKGITTYESRLSVLIESLSVVYSLELTDRPEPAEDGPYMLRDLQTVPCAINTVEVTATVPYRTPSEYPITMVLRGNVS